MCALVTGVQTCALPILDDAAAARGVVTHSSGNHGGALALAARTRGIPCHVVVPEGAVAAKLAAIQAYGAILHRCAPTIAARAAKCAQVQADTGAALARKSVVYGKRVSVRGELGGRRIIKTK